MFVTKYMNVFDNWPNVMLLTLVLEPMIRRETLPCFNHSVGQAYHSGLKLWGI